MLNNYIIWFNESEQIPNPNNKDKSMLCFIFVSLAFFLNFSFGLRIIF